MSVEHLAPDLLGPVGDALAQGGIGDALPLGDQAAHLFHVRHLFGRDIRWVLDGSHQIAPPDLFYPEFAERAMSRSLASIGRSRSAALDPRARRPRTGRTPRRSDGRGKRGGRLRQNAGRLRSWLVL